MVQILFLQYEAGILFHFFKCTLSIKVTIVILVAGAILFLITPKPVRETITKYIKHDPYKFLDRNFERDFVLMDQLRVHSFLLSRSKREKLPLLFRWIKTSNNIAFKLFIIKEIRFFEQKECVAYLSEFLKEEKNQKVVLEIIETLRVLQSPRYQDVYYGK